jgi:hypothetical protein
VNRLVLSYALSSNPLLFGPCGFLKVMPVLWLFVVKRYQDMTPWSFSSFMPIKLVVILPD